ncbi:ImmA/IrrE family metallo-endopeptidase [Syntrophomonas wolfei]|uniref:Zn peptidase-like protein n=1 Tax=Syntrophomonas wolfei subsp. wolfei (strain DSM 2245B / Goettingen) TaxID=335541 RepID=Q0AVF6_SYNWW|nr:ImmA/IrrE family metallo-endopeptidase [Syntrophomonas wolfei]ABI69298.1 Zn peptidase-like protein [Syntrophomonas wolfei subsp. wolfei str. Goettingen G311]
MATKPKKIDYFAIREEAEFQASQVRGQYRLGYRDIGDIFRFMEQAMGYLLIRYPFGEKAMEGFAALYQGERLVLTNSSKILSRERFTAAHEIGHHIFDFQDSGSELIADELTGLFNKKNLAEYRADCFAAALLMPREGVNDALYELGLNQGTLTYTDVVRLQLLFGVSYRAMVRRLADLDRIDREQVNYLYKYWAETGENLQRLFRRAQAPSTALLEPWEQVWVPTRYLRCLEANYETGLLSYPVLQQILAVVGVTPEEWAFRPHSVSATDEVDIDDLIEELSHEI